ncbi:hypothetical protein PNEG_03439 [Pneumocystis murina B123]|uniref:Uncharacterized protein n=1 Tax=Pneumocystis murina (strain B123) TaxID=1069680 RepID=M7PCW1_PNEMU|nr:hypothetical protein PNEG_03439 [Pneumocystis murina B123]EMR08274.1 hypothetical protein PNEG_03439 [Pneumocystis murina B123]
MAKQDLGPKEASLFRQIIKLYEIKQYKKSLKNADQILKKYPEHGETLAMKGLILTLLNKKSEGYEHAHRGLRNNLTSHICWHVFGLLHRLDKNYNEAIKCYLNALKYDKENLQILRDLALLQTHKRLFIQLVNTRNILLQLNPKQRQNWTAYALANYLNGDILASEKVLTIYENISGNNLRNYENSETILYKCTIIMELGNYIEALNYINSVECQVIDKMSIMEIKAKCFLKLQKKEAIAEYIKLLDRNSENCEYYMDLAKAKGLKNKNEVIDTNGLKQMYIDLEKRYPGSYVAKRLLLDFLSGDEFKIAINKYLKRLFKKGTPSTFISIKCLYSDKEKKDIIQNSVEQYLDNLYLKKDILCGVENETKNNDPTLLLWILYFLAQHYDYLRETEKALMYINRAIEHTPTLVELYLTKARIYKHSGNTQLAMFFLNNARKLDLQDRYINTKCAKYMLRNDCNEEALNILSLFTKINIIDGPIDDLVDMQCIWFILEDGQSFLRQKKYNIALKRFETIRKIFNIWSEDQFDFHSYSLRKGTIRTYINCLKWEDNLFSHPFYLKAAQLAIKIYVLLYDYPNLKNDLNYIDSIAFDNKETLKQMENIQFQNNNLNKKYKENEKLNFDDDPNGNKLIQTENPLQDALRFLSPLQSLVLDNIQIYILGFEIYFRQKNYSQALKCILNAQKLDLYHPELHLQIIYFKKNFKNILESQDVEEITQKKNEIFSTDITEYDLNEEFYKYTKNFSAYHVLSYIKSLVLINELSHLEKAIVQLLSFDNIVVFREAFDIVTEDRLKSLFKKLILAKFPLATGFD